MTIGRREDMMNDWRKRLRLALAGFGLVLLAACGRAELYGKLSEAQANEMIAVLQRAGIDASKDDGGETGWNISTAKSDFGRAVEVLQSQGYPRQDFATLGSLFKKEGFVSSPTEERARLNWGLSQELSRTLTEIDGVVQARVHLALPEDAPLAETKALASASVFIKYRPGTDINAQVGKVKALIVNSIEGLKYENVSVETFPAQPMPVAAAAPSNGDSGLQLGGLAILGGILALGALGYPGFRRWQQRRASAARRDVVQHEVGP
ncbi:type III secretion inner membrane ring lipoprotein SctJ [Sphingomonas sp. SUN019]|uniref:type III secretion system inner membrane ring lipoprotein SctJ n=1 Tax=Sphingomonas sp. SUN019 TaxID=2937788 RepID=UPI00216459AA|nr:type III secretion inner membrane ring lipoprotein SctJ [Sphingomonas sp. SUN019]UVO50033.1 type III secretion inner membrane ring lipoprotein SctJ [Sphingomonas sp. SUN019]